MLLDVVAVDHVGPESPKLSASIKQDSGIEHAEEISESFRVSRENAKNSHAVHLNFARFADVLCGCDYQNFMALGREVPGEPLNDDSGPTPIQRRVEVGQIRNLQSPTSPNRSRGTFVRFPST
jgi:hypothetical protein